jgi:hypothetical protein
MLHSDHSFKNGSNALNVSAKRLSHSNYFVTSVTVVTRNIMDLRGEIHCSESCITKKFTAAVALRIIQTHHRLGAID